MITVYRSFYFTVIVIFASSHLIVHCQKTYNASDERIKRNNNEFHLHSIQGRRLNDGKGYSSVFNKLQPPSFTNYIRTRIPSRLKPVHVPPYAVKMEPLVQYSQRDPLYHDKEVTYNVTTPDIDKHSKADTFAEAASNFIDHAPRYGPPPHGFDIGSHGFPHHFYKEPEPIIEIIIKESNETLPTPVPLPTTSSQVSTKEPIQVFYVKYKKNPSSYAGKDEVVYEEPIPALTPLSTDIVENNAVTEPFYAADTHSSPTPPSTTYRTIIRPDSEVYHGTGLKVTFGNHEESHLTHRSSEAQKRDSVVDQNETAQTLVSVERPLQLTQQLFEQRQNQISQVENDYTRFSSPKPSIDPSIVQSTGLNQIIQPNIQQPLQFEDGSFEQPPPPLFIPPANSPKFVFPAPYTNQIPFRPQHTFNFQPQSVDQAQPNIDYSQQSDPALLQQQLQQLQRPVQNQFALNTYQPNNKPFLRVAPQVLPQFQFVPNQQQQQQQSQQFSATNTDSAPYALQQLSLNTVKPQQLLNDPSNRFPLRQNFINPSSDVKTNRGIQQSQLLSSESPHHISYNPQIQLQQANYQRNEFLQQPFSNQKIQQSPYFQQQQQQQQQQQFNERQKQQLLYEKVRQQQNALLLKAAQQRRPESNEYGLKGSENGKARLTTQPTQPQQYRDPLVGAQRSVAVTKTQRTSKTELSPQPVTPIKDGQIYKSISQSEEHQVLNAIDQYGPKVTPTTTAQQQFHIRTNANYVLPPSQPQHEIEKFKTPKQQFAIEQLRNAVVHQTSTAKPIYPVKAVQDKINVTTTTTTTTLSVNADSYTKTKKKESTVDEKDKTKSQLAALPAEVPDDLREQLLASGILSNADIQILDYDKVGDIPIENLPPEALENLYGSGSAPVPSIAYANATKSVEMKVVRYDPSTAEGQNVPNTYVQEDSTEVDPVVLNDSSYNRYLPLKIKGSHFPIPDSPLLKNKKITSVVVLAPVDYDYVQQQQEAERQGKSVPQVHGVRFVSGDSLKTLVKSPTENNFVKWIKKERETPPNKQSVILLVTNSTKSGAVDSTAKEIFMYDIPTGEISKLEGELSSAFVNVAESNAESDDLENLSESANEQTPVSGITSIPVQGLMSDKLKNKSQTVRSSHLSR